MQRRSFLKRLVAGAVSLLGLGTVKAAQPVPVKEPLRIVNCLAGYERWQYSEDGHAERISGGYSRLNRMPEPGEALPFNLHFPSGYRLIEHKLDMPLFEPVVYWRTHIREITKADKRSLLNGLKSYHPMDGRPEPSPEEIVHLRQKWEEQWQGPGVMTINQIRGQV